ncbi:uncharacterized protein LOC113355660 [Papaver somniferum]|uniref:uncharacterized protein LOC113355660 n=1 Tax=Papaver somniferum TaxID=3469 RepID=UPI000E6FE1B4|nr:uncharacterized protein LOC113355660 [Papaver somniferum]
MIKHALSIGSNSVATSVFSAPSDIFSTGWYLDSGASNHMTYESKVFDNIHLIIAHKIHTIDGSVVTESHDLKTGKLVGIGRKVGRLYLVQSLVIPSKMRSHVIASTTTPSHTTTSQFMSCPLALSFNLSTSISTEPFSLIHYDVWGKSPIMLKGERKHSHIIETTRTQLISGLVPSNFGGESVLTAFYTINRVPTVVIGGISPYERLYENERHKLGQKNVLFVFLAYGIEQKGYRCYDPVNRKLRVSRHLTFWSLPSRKSSSFESFTHSDPFPSESNPSTSSICTPESPSPLVDDPPNTDDQDHSMTQPNRADLARDPEGDV